MSVGPSARSTTPTTRTAAATSGAAILTGVPTSRLRTGDLILGPEGMHVRLGAGHAYPGTRPEWPTVTAFDGTVENAADVIASGAVPASYLRRYGPDGVTVAREDAWQVQGNDSRTWAILERGPR